MCQPAARAFGEGWGTLPSRPWPSLVRQHERSLEPYPAWLSLERETVERPIESAGIGVGEGRQHMRRESGRVGGIAEHAAPAFEIAVDEIVPLDAAAFRTTGGQIFAHPIVFEYRRRTQYPALSVSRNACESSPMLSATLQATMRQWYSFRPPSSRNSPLCTFGNPHLQQGTRRSP